MRGVFVPRGRKQAPPPAGGAFGFRKGRSDVISSTKSGALHTGSNKKKRGRRDLPVEKTSNFSFHKKGKKRNLQENRTLPLAGVGQESDTSFGGEEHRVAQKREKGRRLLREGFVTSMRGTLRGMYCAGKKRSKTLVGRTT